MFTCDKLYKLWISQTVKESQYEWKVEVGDRTDHCIITKVLIEL